MNSITIPPPNDFAELIARQASVQPEFDVLTCVHIDRNGALVDEKRSFAQLLENGTRLADALRKAGIEKGDRFALMLHNHPEFVEAMVGAALIGAAFVPLDPRSIGEKLIYMLNFVECKLVIAGEYALPAIADIATSLTHTKRVVVVGDPNSADVLSGLAVEPYVDFLSNDVSGFTRIEPDPTATMFMMFTSGTTGNPKAVVRANGPHVMGLAGYTALGVQAGDTLYSGLPLSHINAQSTLGAGIALGLPVVLSRKFTKSRLWEICRTYNCTVFTLLGGMIPEIYSVPEKPDDADNPVRLVISAGMPASLWNEYKRRFDIEITEIYGSTEAGGGLINLNSQGPVGSMGKAPPGLIAAVLDPNGEICPPGEPGELCFRPEQGDPAPVTYFRNVEASQKKTADGWFRSGDIVHMDENGWCFFHHRAGGGVRRNGDFVNTALVETVLAKSPMIEDVFVYGVVTHDTVAGEKRLVAAIVLADDGNVDDLATWCTGHLQKNEIPEIWQTLDAIPKTVSEKPVERDCIALLEKAGLAEAM